MLREKIINGLQSVSSLCAGVRKDLIERSDSPLFPITSLEHLNRKVWGLRKGLNIIAARTSHGKSCLGLQFAWDFAKKGIPTLVMSLEDDKETIIERLFSNIKEVDNYDLLTGCFKHRADYQKDWDEFIEEIPKELLITDGIGSSFEEVNYMLESLEPKPKCVIIDYIQAIKYTGKNERENLNEYIRQFREICLKNGIAGILMAQMNRMAVLENRQEPTLENLKGTGVLEEHADLVLILQWEYFYKRDEAKKNDFTIYVAKNKRGRTGKHQLTFFPQFSKFKENFKT
jgi:replicative DNA helicase